MSNAAIYLHPDGFDTTRPKLLGRHSAGESFLRGFLRHAEVDAFHFWNVTNAPVADLQAMVDRIEPPSRPVRWIGRTDRGKLREAGVLNLPGPDLAQESWARRIYGANAYSLCAITHTTATDRVMGAFAQFLIAPAEAHDVLICTSSAVRAAVETQLDMVRDYLDAERGPRKRPEPQRATIPLGVNAEDYASSPEQRKAWRERLDIPKEAVVALYMGRFNVLEKMNPALMAIALERAAQKTGKPLYWVNVGWAPSEAETAKYHAQVRALCPSIQYRELDGRPTDVRFSIWSVADFFISFSDNIQETFGLTPIEAMAAGLPCVVTDWDGYKDTVRHGEDGFRITTYSAPPGDGLDLAYWFESGWMGYTSYVAATSQYMAMDFNASTELICALVESPDLRRRMGQNASRRAREVFDWAAIVPQYQALWAEMNARRAAAPVLPIPRDNPWRPDPFRLFGGYPTHHLAPNWIVRLAPGVTADAVEPVLTNPLASYASFNRMTVAEARAVAEWLGEQGPASVSALVEAMPANRRSHIRRSLLWMARYGLVELQPSA